MMSTLIPAIRRVVCEPRCFEVTKPWMTGIAAANAVSLSCAVMSGSNK